MTNIKRDRGGLIHGRLVPVFVTAWILCATVAYAGQPDLAWFHEAIDKIQAVSLRHIPPPPPPPDGQYVQAIQHYVRQTDILFSEYLSPEEYGTFKQAQSEHYSGVGMDILKDARGNIVCLPYPDSPAAKAGINSGDFLLAVDGQSIQGRSIYLVGAKVRGRPGSNVVLTVTNPQRMERRLGVIRQPFEFKSVILRQNPDIPIIRINAFAEQTPRELMAALKKTQSDSRKIIDLRGNSGGDLLAAVKAAGLFLDPGAKIFDLATRTTIKPYLAQDLPLDDKSKIFIWQDENTASAAEVFIAALVQNGRAVSIGRQTYGKDVAQRVIELSDGSAVVVTYAVMRPPNRQLYHTKGLSPTYELQPGPSLTEKAYLKKVHELTN